MITIDRSNGLVKPMADVLEYQASDAKAKWAELLDEVERGRTVRITRHGKASPNNKRIAVRGRAAG
jgi:hypothetical protein